MDMGQALLGAIRSESQQPPSRAVQLNVVTCRGCGAGIPAGKNACPRCGRLQAPPASVTAPGTAAPARPGPPAPAPGMPPRPNTGPLPGGPPRPGFPARPGTGAMGRASRPITGARLLYVFGQPGYEAGQFSQPRGLVADPGRNLYVADTENGRIQVFDPNGHPIREIRPGNGRESFRFPRGVAIAPSGKIYIVDEQDFRIFIFDADGRQLQVWDRRRAQSEASVVPGRLAVSPNGNIFVSEPANRRVMMYSQTHGFTAAFGAGELQSPGGIAVGPKASLYVLDYGLGRVQVFDNKGKPSLSFGRRGAGPGEFSVPRDIAVDRSGHVFVADTLNHRVQIFNPQGEFLLSFGQKGKGDGDFAGPEGIAVADELLYVSDRGNGRVSVFQLERG